MANSEIFGLLEQFGLFQNKANITETDRTMAKLDEGGHGSGHGGSLMFPPELGHSEDAMGHFMVFKIFDHVVNTGQAGAGNTSHEVQKPSDMKLDAGVRPRNEGALMKQKTGVGSQYRDTKKRITLMMPEKIHAAYGTSWELGNISAILAKGFTDMAGANSAADIGHTFQDYAGMVAKATGQVLDNPSALVNYVARGGVDLAQMVTGEETMTDAINVSRGMVRQPHMEFMFKGVNTREFHFEFVFMPKDAHEAETIYNILATFKAHMHPNIHTSALDGHAGFNLFYSYPSEFDIEFYSHNRPNQWLHKVSTCALTALAVDATGAGVQAFMRDTGGRGSPPTQINVEMTFTELEVLTRDRIEQQGF